jgi:hypothetical protein
MKLADVADRIQKALDIAGTHTADDLYAAIESGDAKLWVNRDSIVVTQIVEFPLSRHLNVWVGAGLLDDVIGVLHPEIEDYARQEGCDSMTALGRRGWRKSLSKHGWVDTLTQYRKDL